MYTPPTVEELRPPERTLVGPGPSAIHPRVYRAMTTPVTGHLDDFYVEVMNDVQALLRYVFQTENEHTFAVSGPGSAAMEAAFVNLVEPGETVLVPGNGYFGDRMGTIVERAGGEAVSVDAPWGAALEPATVEAAVEEHDPAVIGITHGETSTGVRQPAVDDITRIAHDHDAYVVLDAVATLGGVELYTDEWDVDVVYAGSQKCLSAPPGASPVTMSDRAVEKVRTRDAPVESWYLDLENLWSYWGPDPGYHYTDSISTTYALREALRIVAEVGLDAYWDRHRRVSTAMKEGLEAMGLSLAVDESCWLRTLSPVGVPAGVDPGQVTSRLKSEYGIEIVGGLGETEGEILRVGCMGHSARAKNAVYLVSSLGSVLAEHGVEVDVEAGIDATRRTLEG
ncbi:pyridoxal-phosphate-dependent aminotransferase family protein [Natrarchaeobius chitinivorans]|uniref:Alanine--glyoxylate aminotransferase family protein n=1 Tax=Natrarchaeobius chitinivorans TaxID=1679083 RepID=A0A3N6LVI4_NATCH|nr:alanine--glyoxylate aminotransferase family protein [Natrarchaeobius chitinivorans]RQG94453.1 alanine--glyoxylate aminotransferase family protein [Natrarchaeobius chitinivorans]